MLAQNSNNYFCEQILIKILDQLKIAIYSQWRMSNQ